jgi:hypothetical protein
VIGRVQAPSDSAQHSNFPEIGPSADSSFTLVQHRPHRNLAGQPQ